ncbi:MAG: nicotinamide-nucleotide amidase [Piscirickettsiaceae bacterium]|nr:nicotinamide-nucleotide amidase [Piscirickettsiaceae bacterium]
MPKLSDHDLYQLSEHLASCLLDRQWLLASAESCTGGWLAKCCTDIVGSSAWFDRGFVTYSNRAKHELIHVSSTTTEQFGAVSEQVAIEMADGALANSSADITVSITGIAGPDGGSNDKPVGTVCFAWAQKNSAITTAIHHFSGNRDSVRRQAVKIALEGLIKNARD